MISQTAPIIQPGQVWRARWDDVLTFVFIDTVLSSFARQVRVAPVTLGDEDADDTAVILPSTSNALDIPLSIWPALVTEISEIVLERWVTVVSDFDSLDALEQAADDGTLLRGLPILNDLSPRWEERRLLELAMEVYASAARIAGGTGELSTLVSSIPSSQLAATLQIPLALARNIRRARGLIVFAQSEKLGQLLNISSEDVLKANPIPPTELVEAARRFERGPDVRSLAKARQETDSDAFVDLVQGVWGLAARGDKPSKEDWDGRIDTYLKVALAS